MDRKMGGHKVLKVLLLGQGDLSDVTLSTAEGGNKLTSGLSAKVRKSTNEQTSLDLEHQPRGSMMSLAAHLSNAEFALPGISPDIVLLSLDPDVLEGSSSDDFLGAARTVVEFLRDRRCHVVVLNASTIDPTEVVSNYHGIEEPFTRKAQRLDLALLELSISHGISIIDADRILAELGAAMHVSGPLQYSPAACAALRDEVFRVVTDYGFFEARPVMAQVGQQSEDGS